MQTGSRLAVGVAVLLAGAACRGWGAEDVKAQAFHPGAVWPDDRGVHINAHGGGILVHEGTFYWFGEHKVAGDAGNYAQVGVHVYSSTELYGWKDEGLALKVSDDPASDIAKGCVLERPKVIFNRATGKFVMWFHLELRGQGYGAARSGVAVADRATGPYAFLGSFRPNAGAWPANVDDALKRPLAPEEAAKLKSFPFSGGSAPDWGRSLVFRRDFAGGQMARDMTLFVDDDGKAYHVYASEENSTLQISQLTDDYLKPAGRYVRVFPGAFNEAPALFKHGGKYWLITSGCSGWAPNAARLAVADSIWGPWTARGNPCAGVNPQNQLGPEKTFGGQSTFVLPVPGKAGAFVALFDQWCPQNAIDGRYLWLPVQWRDGRPVIEWQSEWSLEVFRRPAQ